MFALLPHALCPSLRCTSRRRSHRVDAARRPRCVSSSGEAAAQFPRKAERFVDDWAESATEGEDGLIRYDDVDEGWEANVKRMAPKAETASTEPRSSPLGGSKAPEAPPPSAYSPEAGFRSLSVEELCVCLVGESPPRLLDVRSAEEYAAGHVPGALSVPFEQLSARARAGELGAPDAALAVVCAAGSRSAQACVRLTRVLGFADVRNVTGGTLAWQSAGLPLDT